MAWSDLRIRGSARPASQLVLNELAADLAIAQTEPWPSGWRTALLEAEVQAHPVHVAQVAELRICVVGTEAYAAHVQV